MIVQDIADVPIQKVNTDSKRRRPKVFQCSFDGCGKSFDSQWGLTRHIRTHTKEKPFKCNFPGCGKSFSEKCGLKRHASSHDHTKPYKCPHPGCDKTFKSRDYLDAHRRLHEEEEPYKCKINNCNRCFSSVKSLRKHQAVWHNSKGTESQVEQQLREKYLKVLQRNKERLEKMESHLHAVLESNKALKLENAQYRKDHMIILGRIPKSKKALYDQYYTS